MGEHVRGTKSHTEEALTAYKTTECQRSNLGDNQHLTRKVCSVKPASAISVQSNMKEKLKMKTKSNQKGENLRWRKFVTTFLFVA